MVECGCGLQLGHQCIRVIVGGFPNLTVMLCEDRFLIAANTGAGPLDGVVISLRNQNILLPLSFLQCGQDGVELFILGNLVLAVNVVFHEPLHHLSQPHGHHLLIFLLLSLAFPVVVAQVYHR